MKIKDQVLKKKTSQALAVVDGDISLTYQKLYQRATTFSQYIKKYNSNRAHVAILLPNSANYVIAYCSILLADCVVVPIYYKATQSEIENSINFCDVSIVFTDTKNKARLDYGNYHHALTVICIDTFECPKLGDLNVNAKIQSPDNVAVMLGTSGSTSTPKRVMLSDDNMIENALGIIQSLQYTQEERFLCVLPMTFASGNTSQLVVSLLLGSTLYIYRDLIHPKFLFQAIERFGITTTTIVPSILKTIRSDTSDRSEQAKSLKVICFGGGPTDDTTFAKIINSPMCDKFVHMYGQTEASTRISHLHLQSEKNKLPSAGQPLYNIQVRVDVCEPDGKSGEILVRGPNIMAGYYKEQTTPIVDGWLATGDIGFVDDKDYIYITGRRKNIIIYSGMNIHAEEVENVLCQHPNVKEAVVFAQKDLQFGEIPVAEVVLHQSNLTTEDELRQHCASKLSSHKVPKRIDFLTELKRTYNGKISRNRS